MTNFMEALSKTQGVASRSITENGAVGHSTTGKALLDMNFKISSYRNASYTELLHDFELAFVENPELAIRWLFYARDIRGGAGERDLFRSVIEQLALEHPELVKKVIHLIPVYGRYDDLLCLIRSKVKTEVLDMIEDQLLKDQLGIEKKQSISLLAKWMPSNNASSASTKKDATIIRKHLGMSEKEYRKMLSKYRAYLKVTETFMSANEWGAIKYEEVASKANVLYNKAFFKHDEDRRLEYIEAVKSGEKKINSSTNFPHDIVSRYPKYGRKLDETLEVLWKALPEFTDGLESTLVVADGSGSMDQRIGKTTVTALDVANSLSIYFAERCKGAFANKYITFSGTPQLVNLGTGSLLSKIKIANGYNEVANTNIEAVFMLILKTAVRNNMSQGELPATVLIISDMEFDQATRSYYNGGRYNRPDETLFESIASRFAEAGYKMPKLAFWNLMGRSGTIPMVENENGVALISGFSPSAIKTVFTGQVDPYDALVETLMSERYDAVSEALR